MFDGLFGNAAKAIKGRKQTIDSAEYEKAEKPASAASGGMSQSQFGSGSKGPSPRPPMSKKWQEKANK